MKITGNETTSISGTYLLKISDRPSSTSTALAAVNIQPDWIITPTMADFTGIPGGSNRFGKGRILNHQFSPESRHWIPSSQRTAGTDRVRKRSRLMGALPPG